MKIHKTVYSKKTLSIPPITLEKSTSTQLSSTGYPILYSSRSSRPSDTLNTNYQIAVINDFPPSLTFNSQLGEITLMLDSYIGRGSTSKVAKYHGSDGKYYAIKHFISSRQDNSILFNLSKIGKMISQQ